MILTRVAISSLLLLAFVRGLGADIKLMQKH